MVVSPEADPSSPLLVRYFGLEDPEAWTFWHREQFAEPAQAQWAAINRLYGAPMQPSISRTIAGYIPAEIREDLDMFAAVAAVFTGTADVLLEIEEMRMEAAGRSEMMGRILKAELTGLFVVWGLHKILRGVGGPLLRRLTNWINKEGGKEVLEELGEQEAKKLFREIQHKAARGKLTEESLEELLESARRKAAIRVLPSGELHHPISKKVHRALEKHANLGGRYQVRDPRFRARGLGPQSHRGYQQWHRELDDEIAEWIKRHGDVTPEQFERYLRWRYSQPDLKRRLPEGL